MCCYDATLPDSSTSLASEHVQKTRTAFLDTNKSSVCPAFLGLGGGSHCKPPTLCFVEQVDYGTPRRMQAAPLRPLLTLTQVAINNEVMIAISDRNYAMPGGMLTTWIENVKLSGVKNAMVVALDAHTRAKAEEEGLPAHEMHLTVSTPLSPYCTPKCV